MKNQTQTVNSKTRRPAIRGRNTPKNVHKAFRSHGNGVVIRAALERQDKGYVSESAK